MSDSPSGRGERLTPDSLKLLERFGPKKLADRAVVSYAAWQIASPLVNKVRHKINERQTYTITVRGEDEVYPDLHEWVLSLIPEKDRRALVAHTSDGNKYEDRAYEGSPDTVEADDSASYRSRQEKHVRLRYDGSRTQSVELNGHRVEVEVNRRDADVSKYADRIPDEWLRHYESILFRTKTAAGRDAVVAHMDALLEAKRKKPGPPPFRMANRWGSGWDRRDDLPRRTLESVILREGQLAGLVADLSEFLSSEADYNRRCLPWHRGYLFYGAPGTGKSSVAKALANYFSMPIYYLPLGDVDRDASLMSLIGQVQPRSMLLIEDIDVFHAATARDDEGTVSLSTLLNALDGVWTPHGLITVMTTNNRRVLDSALIRPGRVDRQEKFGDYLLTAPWFFM